MAGVSSQLLHSSGTERVTASNEHPQTVLHQPETHLTGREGGREGGREEGREGRKKGGMEG